MFQRFSAVLKARNLEFWRDKSSLGWNIAFPVLLLAGFAVIFSGDGRALYKVGLLVDESRSAAIASHPFLQTQYLEFVDYQDRDRGMLKLKQHSIDLLVDFDGGEYWINQSSPKGYVTEKLLLQSDSELIRQQVEGREIRYLDWVVPGILGMNMMFSCLFGVGYVIVRYRKANVLRRLKATPLTSFEFVSAQLVSRLMIVMVLTSVIFVGCNWIFDFYMIGSYLDLLLITLLGACCLVSLGLFVASRSRSEELTGGLLNLVSWPMMVLSGVWFSLEGAPDGVKLIAQILPLTHLVDGARAIMTSGDTLMDIRYNVLSLLGMTVFFTAAGAWLFRWEGDGR